LAHGFDKSKICGIGIEYEARKEKEWQVRNMIDVIGHSSMKIAGWLDKLIQSNEKVAKGQSRMLFWQIVMAGALVFVTIGLIVATWLK